jgi:hypothetical protein
MSSSHARSIAGPEDEPFEEPVGDAFCVLPLFSFAKIADSRMRSMSMFDSFSRRRDVGVRFRSSRRFVSPGGRSPRLSTCEAAARIRALPLLP